MELTQQEKISNLPKRKKIVLSKTWSEKTYACNFYNISFKKNLKNFYQYSFQCEPPLPEQSRQLLIQVIKNAELQLKDKIGIFSYKGNMVWGLKPSKTSLTTVQSYVSLQKGEKERTKQRHLVHLKMARVFDLQNDSYITDFGQKILHVLNIKFKQNLRKMKYIEITRNKYYTKQQITEEKENIFKKIDLKILRGFSFTFVPLREHELKARLNLSTKCIQNGNFLQLMNSCESKDAQRNLIGKYVMAFYGNFKIYKIEDIDYEKNPFSQFSLHNEQKLITFKDYFLQKYNLKVKDLKQPMLKVVTKVQKIINKDGKKEEVPSYGYMIPEFMKLSGLIEDQSKEKQVKDAQKSARKEPQEIHIQCEKIRQQFTEMNKESVFQIGEQLDVKGYELPRIQYETSNRNTCKNQQINCMQGVFSPMNLQKNEWGVFYGTKNSSIAKQIIQSMKFAQKKLEIKISDPIFIEINARGEKNFIQKVKKQIESNKINFVLVILNNYEQGYYAQLKRMFINIFNIGSQFLKSSTVYSKLKAKKSILPITTKILLQINAKMGLPVWKIITKNSYWKKNSLMYGALDLKKSNKHKNKFTLCIVGTSNPEMTQFFSDCKFNISKNQGKLQKKQMTKIFFQWFRNYIENQDPLPDNIILFREGSNDYQILRESQGEIQALNQALQLICKQDRKPSIIYLSVNKRVESKFYEKTFQGKGKFQYNNPLPGTVILQELSQGQCYDFHLAAQKVTQGICVPTQYKVIFDNSQVPQDALVELTHEQCYNYANWPGPVRFPSCVQYTTKLSKLMSEHLRQDLSCKDKMKRKLFFL